MFSFRWMKFLRTDPYNSKSDDPISISTDTLSGSRVIGSNRWPPSWKFDNEVSEGIFLEGILLLATAESFSASSSEVS
jgi:hypothetical protein